MRIANDRFMRDGKLIQLIHDLVIKQDVCNFNCSYCMTPESFVTDRSTHATNNKTPWNMHKLHEMVYAHGYSFKNEIDKLLNNYHEYFDAPILKLSGGELMLVKNIAELIHNELNRYDAVQILTNGSLIQESFLNELGGLPNLYIQMSLDGHVYEANRLRANTPGKHAKLMKNLDRLAENNFNIEIYCTITSANIDNIFDFISFLYTYYHGQVKLTCFPVRHSAASKFGPEACQLTAVKKIIDNYSDYAEILLPLKYFEKMLESMQSNERRQFGCHVPYIMMQTFDEDEVTTCPYSWGERLGDLRTAPEAIVEGFGRHPGYHMRTTTPPWAPSCRHCFTDSVVYSLYFDNEIDLNELTVNRPILMRDRARQRLIELKDIFDEYHGRLGKLYELGP